jgi:hypothetical protein
LIKFDHKHSLSVYGGAFFRQPGSQQEKLIDGNPGFGFVMPSFNLKEYRQKFTNISLGIHQTVSVLKWLDLFLDFQYKYTPAYYYAPPTIENQGARIENKYSFIILAGLSFVRPDKEKKSGTDIHRLQD